MVVRKSNAANHFNNLYTRLSWNSENRRNLRVAVVFVVDSRIPKG